MVPSSVFSAHGKMTCAEWEIDFACIRCTQVLKMND